MPLTLDGTNGISNVQSTTDGTAATPAIRGTDTNTGIFFPAADTIAFSEGGVEAARFDANGNFGVGLTPVSYRFSTNVASGDNTFGQYVGGTLYGYVQTSASYLKVGTNAANPVIVETNGTERMRTDSSGNLLIGKTSTDSAVLGNSFSPSGFATIVANQASPADGPQIQVVNINASIFNGYRFFSFRIGSGGTQIGTITTNGSSSTAYNTSSDYRLKENILPMTGALGVVQALKPVTYNWKVDGSAGQGFIAHELQAIVPECVTGEKDAVDAEGKPQYQGIDTSFLVATLTAAIQELKATVDAQAARIAALEAKE
jgi:hypothetical protein